jgi:citrate synthase
MRTDMPREADTLSAREAAERLSIKLPTLYAYVSRGLLRSLPPQGGRGRRYARADVEALRARAAGSAASALRFGDPVLDTRITRMSQAGPDYRGRSAIELARQGVPFESVAELLWTGTLPDARPSWPRALRGAQLRELGALVPRGAPPVAALALALPALALSDPTRFDATPAAVLARARPLIHELAAAAALPASPRRMAAALAAPTVAHAIAAALGAPTTPRALALVDTLLVLLADHELNSSAFAARVAASTGADLYACLSAALAAVSGPLHGGASEAVEIFVREAGDARRAAAAVQSRMRRGELVPGFGHGFYGEAGDPRAPVLIEASVRLARRSPRLQTLLAIIEAARAAGIPRENVDVGVAAACAALGIEEGQGPVLFAIGRTAGWVAHIVEQAEARFLLRPRARFVG